MLCGDRNLTGGAASGSLPGTPNLGSKKVYSDDASANGAGWDVDIHIKQGNFALADGSGSQATTDMLKKAIRAAGYESNTPIYPVEMRLPVP
jgi:hypothetical protein